jgi:hypothetical protein
MGREIDRDTFEESDYRLFSERLDESLAVLGEVLTSPSFGTGPMTIGAELELVMIDSACRPLPSNEAVRLATADPRVALELNRFNLELNASPVTLAGRPFAALEQELDLLLGRVGQAAARHGGRVAAIGILPTIRSTDLGQAMITDAARYRALGNGLRRLRASSFRIQISGADQLDLVSDDVAIEGANTSFQVHLRVAPADFGRIYNAVQLATTVVLAVAGNSPTFLGRRLWDETRVALFKQSVDDRPEGPRRKHARTSLGTGWLRGGAAELFAQSVRHHQPLLPVVAETSPRDAVPAGTAPPLDELRLHLGTVWPWNRGIYDPAEGGHLRIEMRALPAGPTVVDMVANAAYLIGLSLWVADQDERWTYALPFERANHNFYQAAQHGLSARLTWPAWKPDQARAVEASELVAESLPAAREGLLRSGVAAAEADRLLAVIAARAASGQTGAAWQRAALAATAGRQPEEALAMMLDRYLQLSATGQPVHTWPPA